MIKATITSKGQLTVPKDVRDRLKLKPGDRLLFDVEGESLRLTVERRKTLEQLKGSLPPPDDSEYSGKEAEREAARLAVVSKVLGEER